MILLVDAGNTRIKSAYFDGLDCNDPSVGMTSNLSHITQQWMAKPRPRSILASNVAGPAVSQWLTALAEGWNVPLEWVRPQPKHLGLTTFYRAEELGADRWLAMLAAQQQVHGHFVVACAGTALTVDAVSGAGEHYGGIIVPGLKLMLDALSQGTAGLRPAQGHVDIFPQKTADAMLSGAVMSLVGAIHEMLQRLERTTGHSVSCVLSGGDAQLLASHLNTPCMVEDDLVLAGMVRLLQA